MNARTRLRTLIAHPSLFVLIASWTYFLHILTQGKIALVENFAWWSLFYLTWAIARHEARFSFHILYYPLVVYGLVSTISALFAPHRVHALGESMLWFKLLIFPTAIILLREVRGLRDLSLYGYAILASGMSIWGLIEFVFFDQRDLEHRITGPSTHVMTFSGILLPLSVMFLFLWWHQRRPWQLASAVLSTFTLLLTFTRSVWLGWLVAAFSVILITRARIAAYALPVLILFVTFLPLSLFSRLISTFDIRQSSNFDRLRMAEAGMEMIKDYPLLGVGPANVKEVYALYRKQDAPRPRPPHLHNNVIQLWAERGILGLAAYVTLIGLFLRECARAWHTERRMWAEVGVAIVVSLTVAGLFEFNFGDTEVFYLMLNLFALVAVSCEGERSPLQPAPPARFE